jgi:hypothetical protein
MDAEQAARDSADAMVALPAGFMLDGATYERGGALGFDGIDFYTAGRGGAMGDVSGTAVAAAFFFFNPVTVIEAWDRTASVMGRIEAATAFAGCLEAWAAAHLPDDVPWPRLAELSGRLIDAAAPEDAPLFDGWKALAEPDEPKARALQRMTVLRELRGAVHGAAVRATGIEPLEAVLVRTPFMAGLFGWPEPYPDVEDRRATWQEAERATDRAMAEAFTALDPAERAEFVELAGAATGSAT